MSTTQKIEARSDLAIFNDTDYGKLALSKLPGVSENFFIYCCGWLGDMFSTGCVMEVTGGEFRVAKAGQHKGKYSILVPGTKRTVYLTSAEIDALKTGEK